MRTFRGQIPTNVIVFPCPSAGAGVVVVAFRTPLNPQPKPLPPSPPPMGPSAQARLLRLDEFTPGRAHADQEAARDLVRAREDVRGDLMRARHRLSKLLLRQGYPLPGGHLDRQHDSGSVSGARVRWAATTATFETDYDGVLTVNARRDRLDAAIERWPPAASYPVCTAGLSKGDLHPDRVRAGGRDRRLASVHR